MEFKSGMKVIPHEQKEALQPVIDSLERRFRGIIKLMDEHNLTLQLMDRVIHISHHHYESVPRKNGGIDYVEENDLLNILTNWDGGGW